MATREELTERHKNAIKRRMERTRARLAGRLHTLNRNIHEVKDSVESAVESVKETVATVQDTVQSTVDTVQGTVKSTVETVQNTVHETVETAKEALDIRKHPLIWLGGSVVAGFVGGLWLHSREKTHAPAYYPSGMPYPPPGPAPAPSYAAPPAAATPAMPPPPAQPEGPGLVDRIQEMVGPYIDHFKGMGIGAAVGLLRDFVAKEVPPNFRSDVMEIGNNLIKELGGEVLEPNFIDPSFLTGGSENGSDRQQRRPEPEPTYHREPMREPEPACPPVRPTATRV
jgi:ElaB/YqjD/DUF883 family membrane-anchored ribosome-binding protein